MVDYKKYRREEAEFWNSERYKTLTARYHRLITLRQRWFRSFWLFLIAPFHPTFSRIEDLMSRIDKKRYEPLWQLKAKLMEEMEAERLEIGERLRRYEDELKEGE